MHLAAMIERDDGRSVQAAQGRILVRFSDFYQIFTSYMFGDAERGIDGDDACRLFGAYASPKARIGLERAQFIKLWKAEIDAHGLPPPPPVMRTSIGPRSASRRAPTAEEARPAC